MTVEFIFMAEPLQIPETRFITDAEREELLALYAECEVAFQRRKEEKRKEETNKELMPQTAVKDA